MEVCFKQFNKQLYLGSFTLIVLVVGLLVLALNWSQSVSAFSPKLTERLQLEFSYNIELKDASLNDVIQADFIASKINKIPVTFGDHFHWYKISVTNPDEKNDAFRLIVDNPLVDKMTIYQLQDNQLRSLITFGDFVENVSFKNRVLATLPFELSANQTQTFWINVETNGSPLAPINIMQESDFIDYLTILHLIWGAFAAVSIVMAIYNLVLFIGLRDKTYGYYVFYLMSMLILIGTIHGFGYYFLPDNIQLFISKNISSIQAVVSLAILQFCSAFLSINFNSGIVYQAKRLMVIVLLIFAFVCLLVPESVTTPIFSTLQIMAYLTVAMMVAYKIKSRFQWSRYYVFSWLPLFFGAGITTLLYAGALDYDFLTRHAFLVSVMLEVTLISSALADRMSEIEKKQLYSATHDLKSGLANEYYLKQYLENNNNKKNTRITVVAIKITNAEVIFPYIEQDKQKDIIVAWSKKMIKQIESITQMSILNKQLNVKTVIFNNDQLLFVLPINDVSHIAEILTTLSEEENLNPLRNEIPFRLHGVIAAKILGNKQYSSQKIINDLQQCLNHAIENKIKYCIYHHKMNACSLRGVRLAHDLEFAILHNALELYHQPQLKIDDNFENTQYSEVLVRWNHSELGYIPPDEFVLIAEQTGLIKKLTNWVMNAAFMQHKLIESTLNIKPNISINISAKDFSRTGFYEEVAQIVTVQGIDPADFILEITETSQQDNTKCFHNNIDQLKKLGFKLAIDDFGTGYSSLTYISNLPFDELKIDRTFIKDLLKSERQHQIVSATIQMAIKLGLSVTAEGIEDEKTLNKLIELNCHKIQGYFFAKPLAFDDYVKWIEDGDWKVVNSDVSIESYKAKNCTDYNKYN